MEQKTTSHLFLNFGGMTLSFFSVIISTEGFN